jgi:Tfp pilus assembly protein FimV
VNLEPATRDQLLERIRQMREEKPVEIAPVPHRTPRQQAEYEAEVAMGRAMVAKAEAEIESTREVQRKIKLEQEAREGTMTPVYHPNPTQEEAFPVSGATFGKPRT